MSGGTIFCGSQSEGLDDISAEPRLRSALMNARPWVKRVRIALDTGGGRQDEM